MTSPQSYPHTIDNDAGEWLTFERRVPSPGGDSVEGTARVLPGAGPPMHVHYLQDEGFTVVQGRLAYQLADRPTAYACAGESIVFRAGEPHRFWNAGDDDLLCTAFIKPAGNAEFFLAALFASQKQNGGRRPGLFDIAFLCRRYRTEYRLLDIPKPVERLLFPLVVALGTALGRYRKYADAPAPLAGTRSN